MEQSPLVGSQEGLQTPKAWVASDGDADPCNQEAHQRPVLAVLGTAVAGTTAAEGTRGTEESNILTAWGV